ncbi:hypothetical protein Xen7305DRAFT_00040130 [Xenococcus sp. PCC 7305]|uniref:hypothetical protein n=1 Tax=Xenococcus sp. PCC 7305 TaxID=102125 RepID=UPI0002ABAE77|nr:hypothetical protein [Xenococcus sp. PCC 7305]ELS04284.1 hypothetical protein Xen7305DRAFT_00040130 [Xenococcus sp. PCC 7305]
MATEVIFNATGGGVANLPISDAKIGIGFRGDPISGSGADFTGAVKYGGITAAIPNSKVTGDTELGLR